MTSNLDRLTATDPAREQKRRNLRTLDTSRRASQRGTTGSWVHLQLADGHAMPMPDECLDQTMTDRVLQHAKDPGAMLAQMYRVLRPGGVVSLAEPDWCTLAIDDSEVDGGRAYTRYVATHVVRNPTIGRQLPRLAVEAGFLVRSTSATTISFDDFEATEKVLGLRRIVDRAVRLGELDGAASGAWLRRLRNGTFKASVTLVEVIAEKPA